MRISTLRWAIGVYSALLGAMMLIVPHRFEAVTYAVLRPHLTWWAVGFILAAAGLLGAGVVPVRWLVVAAHWLAGSVLLMLAHGFTAVGMWGTSANYAVLGLGTALAPLLLQRGQQGPSGPSPDLLALLIGIGTALTGTAFVAHTVQLNAPVFELIRTDLDWYGVAFIAVGLGLAWAHFRSRPRPVLWAVHSAAAAALLFFVGMTAVQMGEWNGIAYYGGFGALIAILPWLAPAIDRLDPSSLRIRLALVLIVAVAAPLLAAVTIVTDRAEHSATAQALALQQTVAATLADDISRYLSFHQAAAAGIAKAINVAQMTPAQQERLLRSLGEEYPNVLSFAAYDDHGRPIALGDSLPRDSIAASPVFEESRHTDGLSYSYKVSPGHRLVFEFGAPLRRTDGSWAGLLVVSVESVRVVTELQRVGVETHGEAYVVDGEGRLLAHQDASLSGSWRDLTGTAPVAALLSGRHPEGVLRYSSPSGEQLAGFWRVSGTVLGVVVERPLAVAVAGAHAGREIAFAVLLLMVGGAVIVGALAAGALARPLEALAREAKHVGETGDAVALPESRVAEVASLSRAFGEMSTRLAARTRERERAYEALQEREARIRSIMGSTSDGFIFVGGDGRIKSVNQRATEFLPRGQAWAAGADFAEATDGIDAPSAQRGAITGVLRAFLDGRDPVAAGDLEVAGGTWILHWDSQPARDDSGRMVGLTFTLHDVTEERQVSRMKTDFVSFVTHQLRTPLAGIKWMLELASETDDPAELRGYIDDARGANERLVTLVNNLLDISRLESGRLAVSLQELKLDEMTRSVLEEMAPLIKEKGHRISLSVAPGLPPVVADPQLLREVVMNLISNAIKYTPQPGAIAFEMSAQNGSAQWAIQDTGIGIPKDALPRLFEKFYRADNVHTIETEGTGLGLYLVRLIVERLGGRIWCESQEGRGSKFLFTVPLSGGAVAWVSPANVS